MHVSGLILVLLLVALGPGYHMIPDLTGIFFLKNSDVKVTETGEILPSSQNTGNDRAAVDPSTPAMPEFPIELSGQELPDLEIPIEYVSSLETEQNVAEDEEQTAEDTATGNENFPSDTPGTAESGFPEEGGQVTDFSPDGLEAGEGQSFDLPENVIQGVGVMELPEVFDEG